MAVKVKGSFSHCNAKSSGPNDLDGGGGLTIGIDEKRPTS